MINLPCALVAGALLCSAPPTPKPTADVPPVASFKCPVPHGYFPHRVAWKYWQCASGIAYELSCAGNHVTRVVWDQRLLRCRRAR
ncbi:carbohydrate-binding module family 14 protein [Spirillospora sp. CA-294931]|uniref:carbohydrate-binding module family 14 protein n=1 Tax=Spirillospora sp. CA-294931 TaxID=3240042 RepID=UPI003D8A3C0F